jgi:hypothetical protein
VPDEACVHLLGWSKLHGKSILEAAHDLGIYVDTIELNADLFSDWSRLSTS